ncbi:lipoprotein [Bordetella trematum]|uniref:hypothetical protein n=1 Tax=Bordetella trematum TaxID=123899 RepID=UPI00046F2EB5|nr:hypothetical protein [Bordetella trematum]AUL48349.1 hypothetical protein BTL55_16305 [Bordetella trematum]QIM70261.1 hypothetical protein EYB34_02165 [Bordetella trematum]SAI29248.1 lipoprotein [Bordetella trematum]
MQRVLLGVAVVALVAGCASGQPTSVNGVSIESAPRAINHLFGEFDNLVDKANASINASLNDGSSQAGDGAGAAGQPPASGR